MEILIHKSFKFQNKEKLMIFTNNEMDPDYFVITFSKINIAYVLFNNKQWQI